MKASADDVVNKALEYVFSKDGDFQQFLQNTTDAAPLDPLYSGCGDFTKAVIANPGFSLGTPGALGCNRPGGNQESSQIWHFVIPPTQGCTAPPPRYRAVSRHSTHLDEVLAVAL
jgi:hypothetical protein